MFPAPGRQNGSLFWQGLESHTFGIEVVADVGMGVSGSQVLILHVCDVGENGNAVPPLAGLVVIVSVRVCDPPPQETEQAPHAFQVETQFTGQPSLLQVCVSGEIEQAVPPPVGLVVTVSVRVCDPPPQETEQAPHAFQVETQSTTGTGVVVLAPMIVAHVSPVNSGGQVQAKVSAVSCRQLPPFTHGLDPQGKAQLALINEFSDWHRNLPGLLQQFGKHAVARV